MSIHVPRPRYGWMSGYRSASGACLGGVGGARSTAAGASGARCANAGRQAVIEVCMAMPIETATSPPAVTRAIRLTLSAEKGTPHVKRDGASPGGTRMSRPSPATTGSGEPDDRDRTDRANARRALLGGAPAAGAAPGHDGRG